MIRTVILALIVIAGVAAEDVLMGYRRLDDAGLPEDVRVALTRETLDRLWQRAHPDAVAEPPVVDLASGLGRWDLHEDDGRILADLVWPVAVLSESWQEITLPLAGATIRDLRFESGAAMVWTRGEDRLDLRLPPRSQGTIRASLALAVQNLGDARVARLPLPSGGGTLRMAADPAWKLIVADHPARLHDTAWTADLPQATACELVWRRRDGGLGQGQGDLDQDVVVTVHADRLEWTQTLDLGLRGGAIRSLQLSLDPRLRLTTVSGPDLASWRQDGGTLDLAWERPQRASTRLVLAGVIAHADARSGVAANLRLNGAARSGGRIALRRADDPGAEILRGLVGADPGLRRADPRDGEVTAFAWQDGGVVPTVSVVPRADDLALGLVAAVVARDRDLHLYADLRLHGNGIRDAITVDLPHPWQIVDDGDDTGLNVRLVDDEGRRRLILRRSGGLRGGDRLRLHLRVIDAASGEALTLPALAGSLPRADRTWALGDDGGRRLRLDDDHPLVGDATAIVRDLGLDGLTWRGAWQQREDALPSLRLEAQSQRAQITLSHYLVLEGARLQASVHGRIRMQSGSLERISLRLPPGVKVLRARCSQQGGLVQEGQDLRFDLATPTRGDLDLDLDLEVPLDENGQVRLESLRFTGIDVVAQQVVLVEDDGHGLVRRQIDGLVPITTDILSLPVGVDARQINLRWKADLPTWRIDLRRERTTLELGGDGIVTLFDATSLVAADGEIRSRATWHVLNRSRSHLALTLPEGVELWEVRVDGRNVACRRDEATGQLWIPVQPLRAGEAARRAELTWRQAPDRIDRLVPLAPRFADLRLVQTLWRVVPPRGWTLHRRDGTLRLADSGQVEQDRTDRVVEEMRRLRSQGQLQDRALQRCNDNLEALALELKDYASASEAQGNAVQSAAINGQIAQLEEDLHRNTGIMGSRSGNRRSLAIGASVRMWKAEAEPAEDEIALPWDSDRSLERGASLGLGDPAPGYRQREDRHLLGIDLLGAPTGGLSLRGSGAGEVVLALEREPDRRWPWLALGVLVLSGGLALRTWRR